MVKTRTPRTWARVFTVPRRILRNSVARQRHPGRGPRHGGREERAREVARRAEEVLTPGERFAGRVHGRDRRRYTLHERVHLPPEFI